MHPARQYHLLLGSIPQRIVGQALFQLFLAVNDGSPIARMLGQGAPRPGLQTFHGVIVWIEAHEIDGQLTPHNHLFEKCFLGPGRRVAELHGARNRERTDVPEVEIRGKLAGAMFLGAIASLGIVGKATVHELPEDARRLLASSMPAGSGAD